MTKEYNQILEAKRIIKGQIEFLQTILKHLNGTDKILRDRGVWTAWCLRIYFNSGLMNDIQKAIEENTLLQDK